MLSYVTRLYFKRHVVVIAATLLLVYLFVYYQLNFRQRPPVQTENFRILNSSFQCDSKTSGYGSVGSVYWTVFAGRRAMMQIQEKYWVQLHSQGLLTEVHLWDFAEKGSTVSVEEQPLNRKWIYGKAEQYNFVKVLTEPRDDECVNEKYCYNYYYEYYARNTKPNDVVVKVDDDILFVNVSEFKCFVKFIHENQDIFLVSANIVNNAVIAHFQQFLGILPSSLGTFEYPRGGMVPYSSLYRSAGKAFQLHQYFLNHESDFYKENIIQLTQRCSITFVGFSHRHAREIADVVRKIYLERPAYRGLRPWWDNDAVDEAALTAYVNAVLKRKEVVYMRLVVAHGSKSVQWRQNPQKMRQVVQMYRDRSEKL